MLMDSLCPCGFVKPIWLFCMCTFFMYANKWSFGLYVNLLVSFTAHSGTTYGSLPVALFLSGLFLFITVDVIHSPGMGALNAPNPTPSLTTLG